MKNNSKNYFLFTKRLGFREWQKKDLKPATELWGNSKVTRFIGGPFKQKQITERLNQEIENQKLYKTQYWPFFILEDNEFAGCCGLRPYKPEENIFEYGVHIKEKYWGKGLAMEASKSIIDHAFKNLTVTALFAGHNPNNRISKKLLFKLGFEYTHDEFYKPTGLYHPSYIFVNPN